MCIDTSKNLHLNIGHTAFVCHCCKCASVFVNGMFGEIGYCCCPWCRKQLYEDSLMVVRAENLVSKIVINVVLVTDAYRRKQEDWDTCCKRLFNEEAYNLVPAKDVQFWAELFRYFGFSGPEYSKTQGSSSLSAQIPAYYSEIFESQRNIVFRVFKPIEG
jgi:hypothetical protein